MQILSSKRAAFIVLVGTLSLVGCAVQSESDDDEPVGSTSSASMIGSAALTSAEDRWINHVDDQVVARLAGASQQERAHTAAIVTWWALKEGVLDVAPNPWRHNLCTQNGRDVQIGDTGICWGPAWQVGLSGIQVNNVTQQQVESTATRLYPGESMSTILRRIASNAGIGDDGTIATIANSTGALRKSWLLRDPAIGITLQRPFVEGECLNNGYAWCFGSWDTARKFASSSGRIREVIAELEKRFMSGSSPSPSPQGKRCPLGNGLYCGGNYIQGNASTLYSCDETSGITTQQQCAKGCQRMPDGENDRCAP